MMPNKSYALTELSAEDEVQKCCECGENAYYIINNIFAVCENHIVEGTKAFDDMTVTTDTWTV